MVTGINTFKITLLILQILIFLLEVQLVIFGLQV